MVSFIWKRKLLLLGAFKLVNELDLFLKLFHAEASSRAKSGSG
jgi:hypothetical protein